MLKIKKEDRRTYILYCVLAFCFIIFEIAIDMGKSDGRKAREETMLEVVK